MECSVHGQHERAESAVTRRRPGAGLARRRITPALSSAPVLVPGGRLGNGVAAALYIASVWLLACGVAGGRGAAREVADLLRARAAAWPWGRLAAAGRQVRGWQGCQACDHACRPGGADASPIGCLGSASSCRTAGIRLPEPGLQGAQLGVVQVL